ncbi:putative LRR receptor-like serine/threonine-protein kinase [Gossypium australe]|uniref:Putative LRR receptor-like serine/threonine-protein kinase n=1 Tax=Gossypium australe TaxID=47621 RepID=A0A5B6V1S1_9ROSI|nr:putative LRR receptor-like serine/threonine-protein kinase [Gossypium australe]
MGLTLLAQASMPLKFWYFAFAHAVHVIKRLPTPVLQHSSPYERIYKAKPAYSHLRVFGCYKCLDEEGRIFVSRYVVFDKFQFPFQHGFPSQSTLDSIRIVHQQSHIPIVTVPTPLACVFAPSSRSVSSSPMASPCSARVDYSPPARQQADSLAAACVPTVCYHSATSARTTTLVNSHPLQTRSKSGIYKPKVFSSVLTEKEPTSIIEAFQSPVWTAAAQTEYQALLSNHTWDLMPLPTGRREVGCKWVFKIKRNTDGSVARYKGRLVVKGYLQKAGIDFQETFSTVVKPTMIRVVLAIDVSLGWSLRQVDINKAFLNGDLHEEIYMVQPLGFEQQGNNGQQLDATNNTLFIRRSGAQLLDVLVYVDDIIVTSSISHAIDQFVKKLDEQFSLKDLGKLSYFLRIEVNYTPDGILLSQRKSIVGALQYVVITSLDIAFSVNKVYTDDRRSTSEAEYKSLAHVTAEMVWIQSLLTELCVPVNNKALVWCDSLAAVAVAGNPVMHSKFKHVELDLFFVREKVAAEDFQVGHVPSQDQIADILTKPLSEGLFNKFRSQLKVVSYEHEITEGRKC